MYSRITSGILKVALATLLFSTGTVSGFAQQNKTDDSGVSAPEAIALGILAIGAGIVASEIDKEFFTEAPSPAAPTNGRGPEITVENLAVRAIQPTIGLGGDEIFLLASNGQRIPADPNNARDIDVGETWTPNARLSASGKLVIELREWDSFNASDVIDRFEVDSGQGSGRYNARLEGDGGVYEISYTVLVGGVAKPSTRPQRKWGTHTNGGTLSVADCGRNCGNTINFLMVCQGRDRPALIKLPSVGTQNGPAGALRTVNMEVDGQLYAYQARLGAPSPFGHVPSIQVELNDPVIEALQAGSRVRVELDGQHSEFGLSGSRSALDDFMAGCVWTGAAAQPRPASRGPTPIWFASEYIDDRSGQRVSTLSFGVPETDRTAIRASCTAVGAVTLDVLGGGGSMPKGNFVSLRIGIGERSHNYSGQVFHDTSEWSGIRVRMNAGDPLWRAMQSAPSISFEVAGSGPKFLPGQGAEPAVAQFLSACGV